MNPFILVSKSGRRWALAETASDGSATTRETAQEIAESLGFTLLDPEAAPESVA